MNTIEELTQAMEGCVERVKSGRIPDVEEDYVQYENIVDEEKGVYNEDRTVNVNPNSLTVLKDCPVEPDLVKVQPGDRLGRCQEKRYKCCPDEDA